MGGKETCRISSIRVGDSVSIFRRPAGRESPLEASQDILQLKRELFTFVPFLVQHQNNLVKFFLDPRQFAPHIFNAFSILLNIPCQEKRVAEQIKKGLKHD